jgi:hypothetical protein
MYYNTNSRHFDTFLKRSDFRFFHGGQQRYVFVLRPCSHQQARRVEIETTHCPDTMTLVCDKGVLQG